MTHVPFTLGSTATYRQRTGLWLGGVGTGDGMLVLTVYFPDRKLPLTSTYWVEWTGDGVLVWAAGGGAKTKAYTVTAERCSCDGMRRMGSGDCKHLSAINYLAGKRHLRHPPKRATVWRQRQAA